jgi:hypothetical protein
MIAARVGFPTFTGVVISRAEMLMSYFLSFLTQLHSSTSAW